MDRKELVNQSIDYIMQHLDKDLSLDILASEFYISKFHFSRIFKEETGESVYAFIKRCKVDQSAVDIKLNPAKTITDIGLDYGYSSSNYSSVFKKHRNISPTMFKQSIPANSMTVPFTPERVVNFKTADEYSARIDIQELNNFFVIYERFIGSYEDIEENWYQFLDRYNIYLNDVYQVVLKLQKDENNSMLLEEFMECKIALNEFIASEVQNAFDKMFNKNFTTLEEMTTFIAEKYNKKIYYIDSLKYVR